jgi:outer membrane protein
MKKLFKVALVAICMLLAGNFAEAQSKVGYVDFQTIVGQMPQAKTIKTQLDTYSKQFTDQLALMQNELNTKGAAFQKESATMTDAIRTVKQAELQDINKRIQEYQTSAQQQFNDKTNELSKPLIDQVKAAITAVAKEKGYNYVLDSGQVTLIVAPVSDDLLAAVKLKLGLK